MDDKDLFKIYQMSGSTRPYEDWMQNAPKNENYLKGLHTYLGKTAQEGDPYKTDYNEWYTAYFSEDQKKKGQSEGSSPSAQGVEVASADATSVSSGQSGGSAFTTQQVVTPTGFSFDNPVPEKPFIEGKLGEYVRMIPLIGGDLDDWARSWSEGAAGRRQTEIGYQLAIPALSEIAGGDFESEDYMDAVQALSQEMIRYNEHVAKHGTSDELQEWYRDIQKNGNGAYGLMKTLWENKYDLTNIMGSWFFSSMSTQINEESLKNFAAIETGAGAAGMMLGPEGAGAAMVSALPVAFGAMSATTAAGQFFVEELKKEIGDDYSPERIMRALEDDEFRGELRKNAATYGVAIGLIDFFTMKTGAGVAREVSKVGTKYPRLLGTGSVAGTEAYGGMTGEAVASELVGQPATAEEIFQEAAGMFRTPLTMTYASAVDGGRNYVDSKVQEHVINMLNYRAKYRINGQEVNRSDLMEIVDRMSDEELLNSEIRVEDDVELQTAIGERIKEIQKPDFDQGFANLDKEIYEAREALADAAGDLVGQDMDALSKKDINNLNELNQKVEELKNKKARAQKLRESEDPAAKEQLRQLLDVDQPDPEEVLATEKSEDVFGGFEEPADFTPIGRMKDLFRTKILDKFNPVVRLQREAQEQRGERVRDRSNIDMALTLFSSRAAARIDANLSRIDEITADLKENGLEMSGFDMYLYARHAPERNRVMQARYQKMIDDINAIAESENRPLSKQEQDKIKAAQAKIEENRGSGLSDEDAASFMASLTPEERATYERAAAVHDEVINDTRKTLRESGLESEETVDLFETQYEFYTPLKGFADLDLERSLYESGSSKGFDVTSSGIARAEGRVTEATNIAANAFNQNANTHMLSEKNTVGQTLRNFVLDNPNPKIYGMIDQDAYSKLSDADKERAIGVRVGGDTEYVLFTPKYAEQAKTMQSMGPEKMSAAMQLMAKLSRMRSMTFTTLTPNFFMPNFVRDIQASYVNLASEHGLTEEQGKEFVKNTLKDSSKNLRYMLGSMVPSIRENLKTSDPEYFQLFEEFKMDGGKTGWGYAPAIEQLAAQMEKATDPAQQDEIALKWMARKGFDALTTMSDAFENSIRFSTYVNARKAGISRERAAYLSKEATTNFNRQGEWGAALNATYMFFNASVQGSVRVAKSLKGKEGKKIAAGMTLIGAMMTEYNRSVSKEDEDGVLFYDKISAYERSRNIIIMREDGENYVKIPLPYGYGLFHNIGEQASSINHGARDGEEAVWEMTDATMTAFSPVTFGSSEDAGTKAVKTVTPSLFMPIMESVVNEDWRGRKIELDYGSGSDAYKSRYSPEVVQDMFQFLNDATGGNPERSGSIDWNPDKLSHTIKGYLGGVGQFSGQMYDLGVEVAERATSEESTTVDAGKLPIVSKFYSREGYSGFYDYDNFRSNMEEVETRIAEFNDPDIKDKLFKENRFYFKGLGQDSESGIREQVAKVNSRLKSLRIEKEKAEEIEDSGARKNRIKEIEAEERKAMNIFNKNYKIWLNGTQPKED